MQAMRRDGWFSDWVSDGFRDGFISLFSDLFYVVYLCLESNCHIFVSSDMIGRACVAGYDWSSMCGKVWLVDGCHGSSLITVLWASSPYITRVSSADIPGRRRRRRCQILLVVAACKISKSVAAAECTIECERV